MMQREARQLSITEAASLIGKFVRVEYDEYSSSGSGWYNTDIQGKLVNIKIISENNGYLIFAGESKSDIELKDVTSYAILMPGEVKKIRNPKDQRGEVPE